MYTPSRLKTFVYLPLINRWINVLRLNFKGESKDFFEGRILMIEFFFPPLNEKSKGMKCRAAIEEGRGGEKFKCLVFLLINKIGE